MEAMEELAELADATLQGAGLLADDDPSAADRPTRRASSFLTVVAIGNVVRIPLSLSSLFLASGEVL